MRTVPGSNSIMRLVCGCLFPMAMLALPGDAIAQEPPMTIDRVEEDWLIEIGTPAPNLSSPQIVIVQSPEESTGRQIGVLCLNYRTIPEFQSGGLQLQIWDGERLRKVALAREPQILGLPGETLRFTSRMQIIDGQLVFEICRGKSKTWGEFGSDGRLKCSVPARVRNLNDYRPAVSIGKSRIEFGANRVRRLVRQEVRWYSEEEVVRKDSTDQSVYRQVTP